MKRLLRKPSDIRAASAQTLRDWLADLQRRSDAGDQREEVYNTFVSVSNELERRKLRLRGRPELLIPRSALYVMPVAQVRERFAYLQLLPARSELQENTLQALQAELERRMRIAKKVYARRKAAKSAVHTDRVLPPLWRELGGAAEPEPAELRGSGRDVPAGDDLGHASPE